LLTIIGTLKSPGLGSIFGLVFEFCAIKFYEKKQNWTFYMEIKLKIELFYGIPGYPGTKLFPGNFPGTKKSIPAQLYQQSIFVIYTK